MGLIIVNTTFVIFLAGLRSGFLAFFYAYGILALVTMSAVSFGLYQSRQVLAAVVQRVETIIQGIRNYPSNKRA